MINTCPHCQESLNLKDSQKDKIQAALNKLKPGTLLKLGCPHCQKPFDLKADGTLPGGQEAAAVDIGPSSAAKAKISPPPPPDIGWLASGQMEAQEVIEDTPMSLVLMNKDSGLTTVREAFEDEGFLPVFAKNVDDAMDRLQFSPFAAVVLHTDTAEGGLNSSILHTFLRNMGMNRRRNIHYTLIGPDFQTLYDLEALSNSANLVVNDRELDHFGIILKKSLHESQKIFGPLAEAMVAQGRITGSIWLDIKIKAEQKMKSAVLKDLLEVKG
jgi:hypothetical protein